MPSTNRLKLPESKWIDVDGPVHYRVWDGPSSGPTFVLVHGLGGSLVNWAGVAPGLAKHGRVLALDLAGFGLTPLEGRSAHVSANRRLLRGFMEALDLPKVVLVGNSMGGKISLLHTAHQPENVDRLVLVDAAWPRARALSAQPSARVAAVFALYANKRLGEWFIRERARRLGPEGLVRETLRICSPDPSKIDPAMVDALIEMARQRQEFDYAAPAFLEAARSIFRAQVAPGRYRELVRSVGVPALVIHGAQDRLVPVAAARENVREHPNWQLVVFDDLGHIPMMEAPDRWLSEVERWLEAARPATAV